MSSSTTRPLLPTDDELLRVATLDNLNWVGQRFSMDDVLERPEFAKYARLDVARGDFGIAAERQGRAAGAVWALFLPEDDAGYGFIDAAIPELSLWVHEDERGQGLGRLLLRLLSDAARRRNVSALSLSVEEGNFAKTLYANEGFRDVAGRETDGVMICSLETGRATAAGKHPRNHRSLAFPHGDDLPCRLRRPGVGGLPAGAPR